MSKNQKASGITNIINYDNSGNISFVSGSTTLMSVSSSGAVVLTGTMSGGTADSASYAYTASSATNAFNSISASYAYTASSAINAFSASKSISSSYSDTASFANNFTVLGNLTVFGTQSVQYITSSQLNVANNIINVNVGNPGVRFGGLAVYDSGSQVGATGSLLWDSQNNHWVYQQVTGSTYTGGMLISGPRNFGGLGNEQGTTSGSLMKGQGGDHVTSSAIFEDGYKATFYNTSLVVSSSGLVSMGTSNPATNRKLTVAGGAQFTYTDNGGASFNIVPGTNGQDGADLNLSYYTGTGYGPLTFTLGGSERMRIDSNGMIGIGTTPNAWYTGNNSKALQIGVPGVGIWGYGSTTNINTYLLNNAYYDAVGFKYAQASAKSSAYQQNNGVHIWSTTDTTGTSAGDTLSLTERMRITSAGVTAIAASSNTSDLGSTGLVIGGSSTLTSGNVLMLNFIPIGHTSNRARAGIGCLVGTDWGKGNLTFYTQDASSGAAMTTANERMRITSDGAVGIGGSPNRLLDVISGGETYLRITGNRGNGDALLISTIEFYNSNTSIVAAEIRAITGTGGTTQANSGQLGIYTTNAGTFSEKIRISKEGELYLRNPTFGSFTNTIKLGTYVDYSGGSYIQAGSNPTLTGSTSLDLGTADGSGILIVNNGSRTIRMASLAGSGSRTVTADASGNLSASSDSSLKQEDKEYKIQGLAEILQLQPRAYKWLSDIEIRGEEAATEIGFFADEVNPIIPSAAPKGNDDLFGFYDRAVIAAMVKAIQELKAENDSLKSRVEVLETK